MEIWANGWIARSASQKALREERICARSMSEVAGEIALRKERAGVVACG